MIGRSSCMFFVCGLVREAKPRAYKSDIEFRAIQIQQRKDLEQESAIAGC